jgi:MOSC domain-containing protein YiiM
MHLAGHGGENRALSVYQLDSYEYWQRELGRSDFQHGQFGENFTVSGLPDERFASATALRLARFSSR